MNTENPTAAPASGAKHTPTVLVVGVGGAGLQAAAAMATAGLSELSYAVVHTDARLLSASPLERKLLLGVTLTRGLGAGGDPEIGRAAAEAGTAALRELCAGVDLLLIVTGLGKGTGSGAAPVFARLAREGGALVLALAALPFDFEGTRRQQQAHQALQQLKKAADAVICLPNQKVSRLMDENTTLLETFRITNEMLVQGVRGLWRMIARDGLVKADFADLCRVVRGRQAESCFATAEARGENRAREVVEQLQASPMLDHGRLLAEADAVLVSLAGGTDLKQREVNQVMDQINRLCENAEVIVGAAVDAEFEGRLSLTVVAARRSPPAAAAPDLSAADVEGAPPAAEFPVSEMEPREGVTPESRPAPRYVAPPPELTPEMANRLLNRQTSGAPGRRKNTVGLRQGVLPLEVVSKGRFVQSEPTIHRGEDLDTPTYIRRGVALN
jgi:cell division protein FtsZ